MDSETSTTFIVTFIVLQLIGAFLFFLILLSAWLSRGARRHRIFFSFCCAWIVYAISYSLLTLAGEQFRPEPNRILCVIQASLIYAVPFLVMGASLGMTVHLLLNVLSSLKPLEVKKHGHPTLIKVLLTLPWLIWTGMFIGVLLFGLLHQQQVAVSPNGTYCVIQDTSIPKITAISVTVGGISVIGTEVMIGILLYRNLAMADIFGNALGTAIRILLFTIIGFGALSTGIVFAVTRSRGVQFDVIIAILPPAAALTFGTQKDLLMGWRRRQLAAQPVIPQDRTLILTSVNSFASRESDIHELGIPNEASRPHTPIPLPSEATSFLHF
ncbi:hypothetical protein D9619_011339 [Psilocybe cf. subviscida]|uniref:Uncharacterized protein n=1 Tax=Psilocybe cf. subviscida TaxID=2480587 RepID=A0A8H5BJC8_9AGAR|nr:hypothetical protein D9619_011339 [Psilocybe cf. subviscida]